MSGWVKSSLLSVLLFAAILASSIFAGSSVAQQHLSYFDSWNKNPGRVANHNTSPVVSNVNNMVSQPRTSSYFNSWNKNPYRNYNQNVSLNNTQTQVNDQPQVNNQPQVYNQPYYVRSCGCGCGGANTTKVRSSNSNPYFNRSRANPYFNR